MERDGRTRLVTMSRGAAFDPQSPTAKSTLPLVAALERHVEVVGGVDVSPHGVQRALLAALTVRRSRERWRDLMHKNPLTWWVTSANSRRRRRRRGLEADLALQIYGLFQTRGIPYVLYTDTTMELTHRHWPAWTPFGPRTLERWHERERRLYAEAAHVFTYSEVTARSVTGFYGIPADRVTAAGAGANFPLVDGPREGRAPSILYVGVDPERKGLPVLIAAVRALRARRPDVQLDVVGVEGLPAEPGVVPHGFVTDRDALLELYDRATVFCLPARYEPFGLVLLEAMARALPCVGTAVGAMDEIIDHGVTGLVVPPGAPEPLADALGRVLDDPAAAARMGAAGLARVRERYTWDTVADRMAAVIARLPRGGRAG